MVKNWRILFDGLELRSVQFWWGNIEFISGSDEISILSGRNQLDDFHCFRSHFGLDGRHDYSPRNIVNQRSLNQCSLSSICVRDSLLTIQRWVKWMDASRSFFSSFCYHHEMSDELYNSNRRIILMQYSRLHCESELNETNTRETFWHYNMEFIVQDSRWHTKKKRAHHFRQKMGA